MDDDRYILVCINRGINMLAGWNQFWYKYHRHRLGYGCSQCEHKCVLHVSMNDSHTEIGSIGK